jgi:TadE-like protein
MLVLLPLFMGIFQLGLFLHMRNTLTACAHEGARVAANYDAGAGDGKTWTLDCIDETSSGGWVSGVSESQNNASGMVVMTIDAHMPWLGIWGTGFDFTPTGHAVEEPPPGG